MDELQEGREDFRSSGLGPTRADNDMASLWRLLVWAKKGGCCAHWGCRGQRPLDPGEPGRDNVFLDFPSAAFKLEGYVSVGVTGPNLAGEYGSV